MPSLQSRLADLISVFGLDIKNLQSAQAATAAWTQEIRTSSYINSTVTGSDIFTGFTPGINKSYLVESYLIAVSARAQNGLQFAIAGPTSGIIKSAIRILVPLGATSWQPDNPSINGWSTAASGYTTNSLVRLTGIIRTGGVVGAGNIRVQGRSETALTSGLTVQGGAVMRWRELP